MLFHVNALTGENAREEDKKGELLQGFDIIQGPIVEAYMLHTDEAKVVVILDEFLQVCTFLLLAFTLGRVLNFSLGSRSGLSLP